MASAESGGTEHGFLYREKVEYEVLADDLSCGSEESPDVKVVEVHEPTKEERDQVLIFILIHLCV